MNCGEIHHLVSFSLDWPQRVVADWNALYRVSFREVVKIKESSPFLLSPGALCSLGSSHRHWEANFRTAAFGEMLWSVGTGDEHVARLDVGLSLVGPGLFDNEERSLVCGYHTVSVS